MTNGRFDAPTALRRLRRDSFLIICLSLALAFSAGLVATRRTGETYRSEATFAATTDDAKDAVDALTKAAEAANVVSKLVERDEVRDAVANAAGIDGKRISLKAESIDETNLVRIWATSEDSRSAYATMRAITENEGVLLDYATPGTELSGTTSPTLERTSTKFEKTVKASVATFIFSILVMTGISLLASATRRTAKTVRDAEEACGTKSLGSIPSEKSGKRSGDVLPSSPTAGFAYAEAFRSTARKIRNRTESDSENETRTILVASARPDEGKTTFACGLAVSLGETGKSVLAFDLDLTNPTMARTFGVVDAFGDVVDYLEGKTVGNLVGRLERDGVDLIASSKRTNDPTDALSSKRLDELFDSARRRYDYVVVDSPPASAGPYAELLAEKVDASVLVVRQDFADVEEISTTAAVLSESGSKFLGFAFADVVSKRKRGGYEYYRKYGYGYGKYGKYGKYGRYEKYGKHGDST